MKPFSCIKVPVRNEKQLGFTCVKRSSKPRAPKSGDVDVKTAPKLAAAIMIAIASGRFGSQAATQSPLFIPSSLNPFCKEATCEVSWDQVISSFCPISFSILLLRCDHFALAGFGLC